MTPRLSLACTCAILLCLCLGTAFAGGPLIVGGPAVGSRAAFGIDGKPFTWNPTQMPIKYRVDPGPMATTSTGTTVLSNATGLQRVQAVFNVWQSVSSASLSFSNVGTLLPAGSYTGGDLKTLQQYNDVIGSCKLGRQNPVMFDSDGSLVKALGMPPEVIGLTKTCALDTTNGYITGAAVLLNGQFQDGVNSSSGASPNYELTANEFDEAIIHEIGHLVGLDHSQINLEAYIGAAYPCSADDLAGMPLMFPIAFCQSRKDAGLPILAPDDIAWVSKLYPNANQLNGYGTISGYILFGDGVTQAQGINVIARAVDDPKTAELEPRRVAVSAVSGYLFTGNPGQSVTASMPDPTEDNTYGALNGSRNVQLIGYYEIPVPPGTYTVEVEGVYQHFVGGSGVGPLATPVSLPGQPEFWNQDESAYDYPTQRDTLTVHAGETLTDINVILNYPVPIYDQFEDSSELFDPPLLVPFLPEEGGRA